MSSPELLITGNSHVIALADALAEKQPQGRVTDPIEAKVFPLGNGRFETRTFSRVNPDGDGAGVEFTVGPYAASLRRHTDRDAIAPVPGERWGFVLVNHNARIYRHATWLTHEPASVAAAGKQPVTQGVVRRAAERDHKGVRAFFKHLQTAGVDFFAISAPPPRRDHPAVGWGVRPEVIAHIDRTARQVWSEWLDAQDIAMVPPPEGSADAEGFLLPELASQRIHKERRDKHHANAAYGAQQLRQIAGILEA
jgi:hypothetical protein